MKKLFILLSFIMLLIGIYFKKEEVIGETYDYSGNSNNFSEYNLKFRDCELNTNNFIDILNSNYEYKILKIIPYHDMDIEFIYYSNNLSEIVNDFKNRYINKKLEESSYVDNICISNIKIRTNNNLLNELRNKVYFEVV